MAIIAGIDEAGYGPLLGPLVVSMSAFEVPDEACCLWRALRRSVSRRVRKRDARLPIVDSKKLHQPAEGPGALERSALTMLAAAGIRPARLVDLVERLSPGTAARAAQYPWYGSLEDPLPVATDSRLIALKANAIAHDLATARCRFLGGAACIVLEGQYNDLVTSTRNKATALWAQGAELIGRVLKRTGREPLTIHVDRQGGRVSYARLLLLTFSDHEMHIVEEAPEHSHYRMTGPTGRVWNITFTQGGEDTYLPTALASIISKYLREMFMGSFNRYWQTQVTTLRRTAGYYQDGQRFLNDIAPAIDRLAIDRNMLIRER